MLAFAWFMLAIWPLVTIVLFRKLPLQMAICVSIVAGYLILPSKLYIDLPVLPQLNKLTIPVLSTLVMVAIMTSRSSMRALVLPGWVPREKVTLIFLGMFVVGAFGTVLTNGDRLVYGPLVLPRMRIYDAFSILLQSLMIILPLLLSRRYLADREGQKILLLVLVVGALIYTLPAVWEVRMSPQLHAQIYGFFPSSFLQQMRQGGFRPTVFLNHGLSVAIFFALAAIAAAGLWRSTRDRMHTRWALAAGWLFVILVLSKSLGALVIVCLLVPVALFARPRMQLLIAACIAGIVLTYPTLRAAHIIPIDRIMSVAKNIDPARASSLQTRIDNEERLLAKANERPVFGWGSWNRNRVFDENGRDQSITDGSWIIYIGVGGWISYIPIFGLLCWPIIGLSLARRDRIDPICAILALVLSGKLIDLIPNAGLLPHIFLIAGSLLGRLEMQAAELRNRTTAQQQMSVEPKAPAYSRALDAEQQPDPPPPPESQTQPPGYARTFPEAGPKAPPETKKLNGLELTRLPPKPRRV